MKRLTAQILQQLTRPALTSHKGDNGRLLIVAGSKTYHGALLLTCQVASRIVDTVYVHSTAANIKLVEKLKSEIATIITLPERIIWPEIKNLDALLVGPGLEMSPKNKRLIKRLLVAGRDKKIVLDATALRLIEPEWLDSNIVITPHAAEFKALFDCSGTPETALAMARRYHCAIILKGHRDHITNGEEIIENRTGNVGMTKGGTGDVLAGLIASLACTNSLWLAAQAGAYLNGLAGDYCYKKAGRLYNAEDLVDALHVIGKKYFC